jgi:hypothetical protein
MKVIAGIFYEPLSVIDSQLRTSDFVPKSRPNLTSITSIWLLTLNTSCSGCILAIYVLATRLQDIFVSVCDDFEFFLCLKIALILIGVTPQREFSISLLYLCVASVGIDS